MFCCSFVSQQIGMFALFCGSSWVLENKCVSMSMTVNDFIHFLFDAKKCFMHFLKRVFSFGTGERERERKYEHICKNVPTFRFQPYNSTGKINNFISILTRRMKPAGLLLPFRYLSPYIQFSNLDSWIVWLQLSWATNLSSPPTTQL